MEGVGTGALKTLLLYAGSPGTCIVCTHTTQVNKTKWRSTRKQKHTAKDQSGSTKQKHTARTQSKSTQQKKERKTRKTVKIACKRKNGTGGQASTRRTCTLFRYFEKLAKVKLKRNSKRNSATKPPRWLAAIKAVTAVSQLTVFIGQGKTMQFFFFIKIRKITRLFTSHRAQTRRKQKHNPGQTKRSPFFFKPRGKS